MSNHSLLSIIDPLLRIANIYITEICGFRGVDCREDYYKRLVGGGGFEMDLRSFLVPFLGRVWDAKLLIQDNDVKYTY